MSDVTYLRPIDAEGLAKFAAAGRDNPNRQGTVKVDTISVGQFRTLSYVASHDPNHPAVVVDEPYHLFGENTAPAPGEVVLAALGGCLAVGVKAVATHRQVQLSKLEVYLEADIGNSAAWGAGGAEREPAQLGFQAIRVKVKVEGDASREVLDEIVQHANFYSPVANTLRNPVAFDIGLAD